jgi:hypothetical protein
MLANTGRSVSATEWQADPYRQDVGSTFAGDETGTGC